MARLWRLDDPEAEYKLVRRLDSGASGEVWLARNRETQENVGIKVVGLDPGVPELEAELRLEISVLKLCRCPYIVKYYDSFRKDDAIWIVMEYCDVGSLQDLLQYCLRPFTEEEVRSVCASVMQGLAYLHRLGIIHRDIKSKNILINSNGRIKICDFGVAGILTTKRRHRNTAIGSPHWMAPEVIAEKKYDARCDIWSFGITVLELGEMEPPYADLPIHELLAAIPSVEPPEFAEPDQWSPEAKEFLQKLLTKDPSKRPTAADMLNDPFIDDEVERQKNGELESLISLVQEAVKRIVYYRGSEDEAAEAAAENENEEGPERRRSSVKSNASAKGDTGSVGGLVKRLSSSVRRKSSRIFTPKPPRAGKSRDGDDSDDDEDGAKKPLFKRTQRTAKKDALMKGPTFRKKSIVNAMPAKRKSILSVEGIDSDSDDSFTSAGEMEKLSPEEIKLRDQKAEEIKQRLLKLYAKFDRGETGDGKSGTFFDNFGKMT